MRSIRLIEVEVKDKIATVTLSRPEVHNALNEEMISELTNVFSKLNKDEKVRVIILQAKGKSFCAGGDLDWMKAALNYTYEENIEDAKKLALMFKTIYECSKPVIGVVQGAVIGGGVGLVSVCDMSVALDVAVFSLSEVKLGLLPAVISPFVMKRIIPGEARRYFLTSEKFTANEAKRIGLISEVVKNEEDLNRKVQEWTSAVCRGGPEAISICKKTIREVQNMDLDEALEKMAKELAKRRVSEEGQEGIKAFFEKRDPKWMNKEGQF